MTTPNTDIIPIDQTTSLEYTNPDYNPDTGITGDLTGGINYKDINHNGGLYNSVSTRGGRKAKPAKTTKKTKTTKPAKTAKTAKKAKPTKSTKTAKKAKPTKIPKKILNKLYEKINVLYIQFNKKNKSMKGGGDNGIPDTIFNMSDLDLRNFIPSAFDPSPVYGSPLSKFAT